MRNLATTAASWAVVRSGGISSAASTPYRRTCVETMLLHSSGEFLSEVFVLPVAKHDALGSGSCVTYARRYALASFVGVCPEDDDGNAAADSSANLRKKGLEILQTASKQGLNTSKRLGTVSPAKCGRRARVTWSGSRRLLQTVSRLWPDLFPAGVDRSPRPFPWYGPGD